MEEQAIATWYLPLVKGIILILLSVIILLSPAGALIAWAFYIGIGFVFTGMVLIYRGFAGRDAEKNWTWRVFEGILDMFIGFILMTNPLITASILPFLFGFWGAFYGIALFIDAFSHEENKIFIFIVSVAIFWLSSLIMFNPLMFGIAFATWLGIILLIAGLFNLIESFTLKKMTDEEMVNNDDLA